MYVHLRGKGVDVGYPVVQYDGMTQVHVTDYDAFKLCFQWAAENVTDSLAKA